MKAEAEKKTQKLYDDNKKSFEARNIQAAEITYYFPHPARRFTNSWSGPAHSNQNDPALHVTAVCLDAQGNVITVRHVYVDNIDE